MPSSRLIIVLSLTCALGLGCSAMAAPFGSQEPVASTPAPDRIDQPTLEISSADGKWFIDLAAMDLGPVRLPLLGDRTSAILVSAKIDGDKLILTLAGEKGELETSPIGRYELRLAKGAQIAVPELEPWKTGAWSVRIVPGLESTMPGCCSCTPSDGPGKLESRAHPEFHRKPPVQCCPNLGRCMGCGTCGTCCS
jgi:hypothetical protein